MLSLRTPRVTRLAGPVGVFAIVYIIAAWIIFAQPALSPNDEEVHLDYLDKVGSFHVPAPTDLMGQTALRAEACRGFYGPYQPPPVCDDPAPLNPTIFQFAGSSRAADHPPLYYAITRVAMVPVGLVAPGDFTDTARLANVLWLIAGLAFLWSTLRRFRVNEVAIASVTLLVALNPNVMQRVVTVGNDATAVFAGAVLLYVIVAGRGLLAVALVSALVFTLKLQNAVAIASLSVAVLLGAYGCRSGVPNFRNRRAWTLGAMVAGVAVALIAWRVFQRANDAGGAVSAVVGGLTSAPGASSQLTLLADNVVAYAFPLYETWVSFLPVYANSRAFSILDVFVTTMFVGTAIASLLTVGRANPRFALSGGALFGLFVGPALLAVGIGIVTGVWMVWAKRYGLSVVPMFAVTTALVARTPTASSLLGVTAAVYVGATVWQLLAVA